jgi:hypothetical protein
MTIASTTWGALYASKYDPIRRSNPASSNYCAFHAFLTGKLPDPYASVILAVSYGLAER